LSSSSLFFLSFNPFRDWRTFALLGWVWAWL
jgi:hypothetical protein